MTRAKALLKPTIILPAVLVVAAPLVAAGIALYGWYVPLALAGLGFVVLVFLRPKIGLYVLVMTIPFEAILLLNETVSFARIVGAVVFVAWIAQKLVHRESITDLFRGEIVPWLMVYILLAFASMLWATYKTHVPVHLLTLVQLFGLYILATDLIDSWGTLRKLFYAWLTAVFLSICVGLYQFFVLGAPRGGADISGTENEYAAFIVVSIPVILYFLSSKETSRLVKFFSTILLPLGLLGVAVSLSRTGFIALFVAVLLQVHISGWGKQWVVWPAVILGFVVVYGYIPWEVVIDRITVVTAVSGIDDVNLFSARGFHWQVAVAQFLDSPLWGMGYYNYGYHFLYHYQFAIPGAPRLWDVPRSPHSLYLGVLANLGLLGFILLLVILYNLFRVWQLARHYVRHNKELYIFVGTLRNCLIAYLVYGLAADIESSKLLWLLFAVAQTTYRVARQERPQPVAEQEVAYGVS